MVESDLESLPGVGPATADKLVENGFDSYQSIAVSSPGELSNEADIGESTANDVIKAAREKADIGGFESGMDVKNRRKEIGKISWRVDEVNDLLGGGTESQAITEVYGEFGSGKSQISHQLAINVQLPEEFGGLGQSAIFIDTEDTFRPNRIEEMARGLSREEKEALMAERGIEGSLDDEEVETEFVNSVLEHIKVAKAFNSNHQILLTQKALEQAKEMERDVGLLVIDSLTAHFRAEYVGRGELAERQQKMNKHLHDVSKFADMLNAAVLITNQVASNPNSYFGDPTQPVGGNILGHKSTLRIYLKKSKGTKRIVRLVDSPDLADGEAIMRIEGAGVVPE